MCAKILELIDDHRVGVVVMKKDRCNLHVCIVKTAILDHA